MTVWMMCSSTPLKKQTLTFAVLIVQVGVEEVYFVTEKFSFSESNVTGTIVSFEFDIRKAPPLLIRLSYQEVLPNYMRCLNTGLCFLIQK